MWIATVGGVGFAPVAPGTFGAVAGALLFFGLSWLGLPLYALTVGALTVLGVWSSDLAEADFGRSDDGRIVVDEVAGQLIALAPLVPLRGLDLGPLDLGWASFSGHSAGFFGGGVFFGLAVTAFVLFRVLDIAKPGPVRWAERRFTGGTGVMLDDVIAGGLAAVAVGGAAYALVVARLATLGAAAATGVAAGWGAVA